MAEFTQEEFEAWVNARHAQFPRFTNGQTVIVDDKEHVLYGWKGVVMRPCIAGLQPWHAVGGTVYNVPEAWVKMERIPPPRLRKFPLGDDRANYVKLDCCQCLPVTP